MRCSRLIIIFGIVFALSYTLISYERFVLKTVLRQRERIDRAAEMAADVVAEELKKGRYEPGALLTAEETFNGILYAVLEEEGHCLKEFYAELNGVKMGAAELEASKKGDSLQLYFEMEPEIIYAPGRHLVYEKRMVHILILD